MNEKSSLLMNLRLDLAESYIYGTASSENQSYAINIQAGATGLVLPKGLYKHLSSEVMFAKFTTEAGKSFQLELPVRAGRDMIEIYDDNLTLRSGWDGDMPVSVELMAMGGSA